MKVLDLFCGAGGLSSGFSDIGCEVTGIDYNHSAVDSYNTNINNGNALQKDLFKEKIKGNFDLIVGGPPCKPWSSVNVTRRGKNHHDYGLLSVYFEHVARLKPKAFLLENVPLLNNTDVLQKNIERISKLGFKISKQVVSYSDFGAPTRRRRLLVFGVLNGNPDILFEGLSKRHHKNKTVKDAIWYLRREEKGAMPDHDWPILNTIRKYKKYYKTGKYGWYILKWNEPAHSFGNIMKTYILHPDSFKRIDARVISVKEALLVMGFNKNFKFPAGIGLGERYQMVADSVSPVLSFEVAKTIKQQIF